MSTEITIHPTAKIALKAVVIALVVGGCLLGLKRFLKPKDNSHPITQQAEVETSIETITDFLLPVIRVSVDIDAHESDWSKALAKALKGRTEVTTEHGRVDVLTERFAIEVDRLAKWHESIGQASHYAQTTQKKAVVALIVLPSDSLDKLELIENTCASKDIKLIILQSNSAKSNQ